MKNFFTGKRVRFGKSVYKMWSFAVVVPLLMFALQLDACTGASVNEESETAVRENTAQSATASEILSDSDAFYGAEVTVTGEVTEVITPLTFELEGDINSDSTRYGESADGILIVKNLGDAPDPEVEVGETVEVTGTVREFDVQQVESDISGELAPGVFTYWAGQTALVATSVEPTGGAATTS